MAFAAEKIDAPGPDALTIMIVDDEAVNRIVVKNMLTEYRANILEARDGREACELCLKVRPDLILMDVMMPEMNGLDATTRIKRHFGEHFVPVVFLTALADDEQLSKCIEVGGDDFLVKPISKPLFQAKVSASLRALKMHRRIAEQRDELSRHQARLQGDMEIAQRILEDVESQHHLGMPNVHYVLRPMETMNGDVILGARRPSGNQIFMVGDFTGHGLPAAIGAQTVNGVFTAMASKGLPLPLIVTELNRKLRALLPVGRFLSACIIELDKETRVAQIWNGGMPDVYVRGENSKLCTFYPSTDLPLGIVDHYEPNVCTTMVSPGTVLVAYSDGVIEAQNEASEQFGAPRLLEVIQRDIPAVALVAKIVDGIAEHVLGAPQRDDISLLVVEYAESVQSDIEQGQAANSVVRQAPLDWDYNVTLAAADLKTDDPVAMLVQVLDAAQGLGVLRTQLFMILTELYSNALEHGLLRLDSKLKHDEDGFSDYYFLRKQRLAALEHGEIRVRCTHRVTTEGGELIIGLRHNGVGFDSSVSLQDLAENREASGRGIRLLRSLCHDLRYEDEGRSAFATYRWRAVVPEVQSSE